MNKLSLALNGALAAAVIGLYVLHFQKPSQVEEKAAPVVEQVEEAPKENTEEVLIEVPAVVLADSVEVVEEIIEDVVIDNLGNNAAFIDFDRINVEWKYFQRETKRIEDAHLGDLQRLEEDKKKLETKYRNYVQSVQGGGLQDPSTEEFIQKEQIRISQREQQLMSAAQNEAFKANTDGMKKMKLVLKDYAKKKGYSYIIATGLGVGSPVLYNQSSLDITDAILSILNKKHK